MQATQNNTIIFQTHEAIDPRSWEIMGLHVKTSDNPIGMFGTGLKYAIAVLLRTGHQLAVIDNHNNTTYKFSIKEATFRGEAVRIICCNDKELAYTDRTGMNWKTWMAYRELVSNTNDEGGLFFTGDPQGIGTEFVVTVTDQVKEENSILEVNKNHDLYFLDETREAIAVFNDLELYVGTGKIYCKGILVHQNEKGMFDYNLTLHTTLTEDRTLDSPGSVYTRIYENICNNFPEHAAIRLLTPTKDSHEDTTYIPAFCFSPIGRNRVSQQYRKDPTRLPQYMRNRINQYIDKQDIPKAKLSHSEEEKIAQLHAALTKLGYIDAISFTVAEQTSYSVDEEFAIERAEFETRSTVGLLYLIVPRLLKNNNEFCNRIVQKAVKAALL